MAIYLQLGGITGNVTNQNYKNWIAIQNIHWAVHVDVSTTVGDTGNRMSAGKITPSDVSMQKEFDIASVPLLKLAFAGKPITSAQIVVTQQASDSGQAYLTYTLSNVILSSFSTAASSSGTPTDSLTLNFAAVEVKASPTDDTGTPINTIGGYDFSKALPV